MRSPAPPPPPPQTPSDTTYVLEINLISAQGLKPPSTNLRHLQTYAVAWVDPSNKRRTRTDRTGAVNPNWNDKFIFPVTSGFFSGQTSAVNVEIYSVGVLKDSLLGSVRLLLSNFISPTSEIGAPAFIAVQIRRPSGRFHGVLNVGAMVIDGSGLGFLTGVSAIGYRDLMGDGKNRRKKQHHRGLSDFSTGSESCGADSADFSDGTESTASTSSSTTAASAVVLKELNGRREMAGKNEGKEGIILCGLGFQKKIHSTSSDQNIQALDAIDL